MSAYVPEHVYGFTGWDERNQPTYGLVPWPEHLRPRETVALTKKGEAYAEAVKSATVADLPDLDIAEMFGTKSITVLNLPPLIEAQGVFFLTITKGDRTSIATSIERLIAMLDAMDGDENLEPSLGGYSGDVEDREYQCDDEGVEDDAEEENEHGGDILDEPHDDEGEAEPFLGWHETSGQGAVGLEGWSRADQDGMCPEMDGVLHFDGDGYHDGQKLLRDLQKRRPDKPQQHVRISPAIGRNRP